MKMDSTIHHPSSKSHIKKMVKAHSQWVTELIEEGWTPYIITFMFHEIPGGNRVRHEVMRAEVNRVYETLSKRLTRKPWAESHRHRLPIFILLPDFPVFKHQKQSYKHATINDGLHMQGMAFLPLDLRLRTGLREHFQDKRHIYIKPDRPLKILDAKNVFHTPEVATEYVLKALFTRRSSLDDLIIM